MKTTRIIGVLLLGLGAILIIVGLSASRSLANELSTTFFGRLTQGTMWYILGGVASVVVGLVFVLGNRVSGRT